MLKDDNTAGFPSWYSEWHYTLILLTVQSDANEKPKEWLKTSRSKWMIEWVSEWLEGEGWVMEAVESRVTAVHGGVLDHRRGYGIFSLWVQKYSACWKLAQAEEAGPERQRKLLVANIRNEYLVKINQHQISVSYIKWFVSLLKYLHHINSIQYKHLT